jgi:hypothetical protein
MHVQSIHGVVADEIRITIPQVQPRQRVVEKQTKRAV